MAEIAHEPIGIRLDARTRIVETQQAVVRPEIHRVCGANCQPMAGVEDVTRRALPPRAKPPAVASGSVLAETCRRR